MKFTLATIAAAIAFLPMIEAHLAMVNPGVYGDGVDPLPPLAENGSNFPCAISSFNADGDGPTLNPGQGAEILLKGTAVHSGGSCQVSITYDQPPTKNSVWKVMKSFEGGCPVQANGNLPDAPGGPLNNSLPPLGYTVPDGIPAGKATIAWTWFNKSGNREMYMRCHKATIGGNGSKGAYDALPDMFVAQLHTTTCKVPEGISVKFPNPGSQVQGSGDGNPTGDCGSKGGAAPPPETAGPPPPPPSPPTTDSQTTDSKSNNPPPPSTGGPCSDGQKQCGGGSWSMCANGAWVNMGALAAGTDCSAITKRSIRFSAAHMAKRAV